MPDIRLTERLLEIIFYIYKSGPVTITDIYNHFEKKVPRRTLQTNLKNLSSVEEANIPRINIVQDGRTYVYSIDKTYKMPFLQIDGDEALTFHALKNSLSVFKNTKIKDKISSLANKIDNFIPDNVFADVEYFKENLGDITLLETGTYDYSNYREIINDLINAIIKRRRCKILYRSEFGEKEHLLDVFKLFIYKGSIYFFARIEKYKTLSTFLVHRIEKISVLDDIVELSEEAINKMMRDLYKGRTNIGIFENEAISPQKIRLKFSPSAKGRILNRQWHPTQKNIEEKDGSIIIEFKIGIEAELLSWIAQWREEVVILSPPELQKHFKKYGQFLLENYNKV